MSPNIGLVRPEALPLLGIVAILAVLALWAEVRRRRALVAFAGRGADLASVSEAARRVKVALVLAATIAAVVALAGPYVDVVERTVVQSGVDLVVALDVSQSMAVRDVEPDRLRAGKEFIRRLGDSLSQSRVALVLFAGEGIVRYPPTADPSVLGQALDSIGGGFRPQQGGSSLRAAIDAALGAFPSEARESARRKAIVLVGDGEDLSGLAPDLERLRQLNIRMFTVGVGTPSGGQIPTYDRFQRFTGMLRAADGGPVASRLDENTLRSVADETGGRYWRLSGSGIATVNEIVTELRRLDASQLGEVEGGTIPDDRYQILLALAVAILIVEGALSERRRMPRPRGLRAPAARPRLSLPSFGRASTLGLVVAASLVSASCAEVTASEADRMYLAGDHEGALERYRGLLKDQPDLAEVRVSAGNALHQMGRLEDALAEYAFAVRAGTTEVRAIAHYQRGNTLFRLRKLEEAREAYKDALRLDPKDRDAKFNIEVISELLREQLLEEQRLNAPGPQGEPGQQGQGQPGQGQPGSPVPGQSGAPAGSPRAQDSSDLQMAGPQASGPPSSSSDRGVPSVSDALSEFRSTLSIEEVLDLLDALLAEQKGIEILLEQQTPQRRGQDPTY
jgi:Ca-activated chloride channel family protein